LLLHHTFIPESTSAAIQRELNSAYSVHPIPMPYCLFSFRVPVPQLVRSFNKDIEGVSGNRELKEIIL